MRKKTKKVLAYVLAAAVMFSNFVGFDLTAKAADVEQSMVTNASTSVKKVPATNAVIKVEITGKNLPVAESDVNQNVTLHYTLLERNEKMMYVEVPGYEKVAILSPSNTGGEVTIKLPDNSTTKERKLRLKFEGAKPHYMESKVTFDQEAGGSTSAVDKKELADKITALKTLNREEYTAASWEKLAEALTKAEEVNNDPAATAKDVEEALAALTSAEKELKKIVKINIEVVDKADKKPVSGVQFTFTRGKNNTTGKEPEIEPTDKDGKTAFSLDGCAGNYVLTVKDTEDYTFDESVRDAQYMIGLDGTIYKGSNPAKYEAIKKGGETPEVVDKTKLNEKIEEAKKLVKEEYTEETWTALQTALTNAQGVSAKEDATKEEVATATETLKKAIEDLKPAEVKKVKVTNVSTKETTVPATGAVVEVEIKGTNLPTETSQALLYKVLAKKVVEANTYWLPLAGYSSGKEIATPSKTGGTVEINLPDNEMKAAQELVISFKGLNNENWGEVGSATVTGVIVQEAPKSETPEVVDKTELNTKIEAAKKLVKEEYTAETWAVLQTALTNAQGVSAKEDATKEEVTAATEALVKAIDGLKKVEGDVEDGKIKVTSVSTKATTVPTTGAVVEVEIKGTNLPTEASQSLLYQVLAKVSGTDIWMPLGDYMTGKAIASPSETGGTVEINLPDNKATKARELVISFKGLNNENWGEVGSATVTGVIVQEAPKSETPEVVDKTELNTKIEAAKKLVKEEYTEETWAVLQTALTNAQGVSAKEDATKEEVTAATEALVKAIDGLKKVEGDVEDGKIKVTSVSTKATTVSATGAVVEVEIKGTNLPTAPTDSKNKPLLYQVLKRVEGSKAWTPLENYEAGKEIVSPNKDGGTVEINLPDNTTQEARELVIRFKGLDQINWETKEGVTATGVIVQNAPESSEPEPPVPGGQVLSDKKTFRAKVVDENQQPLVGINFSVNAEFSKNTVTTNARGVLEYQLNNENDWNANFTVKVEDPLYTSDPAIATFETDEDSSSAQIIKINGKDLEKAEEVVFVLKKVGGETPTPPPSEQEADKTALKAEIAKTADLVQKYYTTETWSALQSALTEAKKVEADKKATKEEVATATETLKAAMEGLKLVLANENDKEELRAKHDELKAIHTNPKYTVNSRKDLASPIAYARYVLNDENASLKDVAEALKALKDAESKLALKEVKGVTKLNIKLVDAEGVAVDKNIKLVKDDVQYNVQENLLAVNGNASFVLTGWESKNAKNDFEIYLPADAEYIATPAVLKIDLENEDGSSVFNTVNGKPVGDGVVEMKLEVKSKDACDKTTFRAYAQDEKGNPLKGMKFDAKNADLMDPVLISDENGMISYEVTSWDKDSKISVSLQDGQGYYSKEKFEFEVVEDPEESTRAIISTINGKPLKGGEKLVFTVKPVNKVALEKAVAEAKAIQKGNFTDESWKVLQDALAEAEKVLKDEKAAQTTVDAQVDVIAKAVEGLTEKEPEKPVVNKAALEKAVADAKAIQKGNFTDESWKVLQDAIAEAEKVLKDEKAAQTAVDAQVDAIAKAVEGLTEKEPEKPQPEEPKPEEPKPENPKPENPQQPTQKPDSQNVVFDKANGRSIRFNTGIEFEDLDKVIINGKVVDPSHYTVKESEDGKAIVILKESYLEKLANGNYTFEVVSKDGTTESATFVVKGKVPADKKPESTVPKTGDAAHPFVYVIGMLAAVGVCVFAYRRKRTF